ncbi:MAG: serine hydrolase, partial [Pseudomonadota bacterium]
GNDFSAIADELLLTPLGMTESTFAQPIDASLRIVGADADFAPHRALFSSVENSWYNYPEKAAAGLWTTAEEYGVFARALLKAAGGQETAIPVSVSEAMLTPVVTPDWASDAETIRYGLGVVLELDERGDVVSVAHSGGNTGYKSYFTAIPQTGDVIVSMGNTEGSSPLNVAIVNALIER